MELVPATCGLHNLPSTGKLYSLCRSRTKRTSRPFAFEGPISRTELVQLVSHRPLESTLQTGVMPRHKVTEENVRELRGGEHEAALRQLR